MNSKRPSKPNLPNAPKPSKLLAPTELRRTLSSLAYWILQLPIASTKWIGPFWTVSQAPKYLITNMGMVR